MELSVVEAAELLGVRPRALRARLARGSLAGRKVDGAWRIRREDLPLTETQRRRMAVRADQARRALDAALPTRLPHGRTLVDLDAFRAGAEVLESLRDFPEAATASEVLRAALRQTAAAAHTRDRRHKAERFDQARAMVGEAAGLLLLTGTLPPTPWVAEAVARLECQVSPALAGLARWARGRGKEQP